MTVLLQVSDTHFGAERRGAVEALVRLSAELSPDILVLSGDITQRAQRSQFASAKAFVERLHVPTSLVIPGNHDVPLFNLVVRALDPYRGVRRAFESQMVPRISVPDCLVLGVKTTRRYRYVQGELGRRQYNRVERELRAALPEQLRVIVTHHPVAVPRLNQQPKVARGAQAAVRAWAAAGVDVILSGHIHLPFVLPLHEQVEALAKPVWAIGAGTAVSRRVRHDAGNAVNVLRIAASRPRTCVLEIWAYSAEKGAFVLASHKELG